MDHFGIGAALLGAAEIYFRATRGTGRTTSLVESVKTGDRVIFATQSQAARFKSLCGERKIEIETRVCNPANPGPLFEGRPVPGEGRLIFDHVWLELFYLNTIDRAQKDINHLQRELSGRGTPHLETRRAAQEFIRWCT